MRVTTILDLLGVALVVYGAALLSTPAAIIVGGVAVLAMSYAEPWKRG